jgi:hypothetical protein
MAKTAASAIRKLTKENPKMKAKDIAATVGTTIANVYATRYIDKKKTARKTKPMPITLHEPKPDPVNHPEHYKIGGVETIDFITAKKLNYNLGNVVKYITRADYKGNREEDLAKARWYLNREIAGV